MVVQVMGMMMVMFVLMIIVVPHIFLVIEPALNIETFAGRVIETDIE